MISEPAFPVIHNESQQRGINEFFMGMSLRDYFAAKALQGWREACVEECAKKAAEQAYAIADAMLKARNGGAT